MDALLRVWIRVTLDEAVEKSGDDFGTTDAFLFADVLERVYDVGRNASGDALESVLFHITLGRFTSILTLFVTETNGIEPLLFCFGCCKPLGLALGTLDIAVSVYGGRVDLVEGEQFFAHQFPSSLSLDGTAVTLGHCCFYFGFPLHRSGRRAVRREGFRVCPPIHKDDSYSLSSIGSSAS